MNQSLNYRYTWSPLFGSNAPYVEELYDEYLVDPAAVAENWREFFAGLTAETDGAHDRRGKDIATAPGGAMSDRMVRNALAERAVLTDHHPATASGVTVASEKQAAVARLIQIYGMRGHQVADLDPLGIMNRRIPAVFKLDFLGLSEADMETEFYTGGARGSGHAKMRLRDIIDVLKSVYCGRIGADFAHLSRGRERIWIRERLERRILTDQFTADERHTILDHLTAAEGIERYLHTKYVGQKRFSLEGGESLIPMLGRLNSAGRYHGRAGDCHRYGASRADKCAGQCAGQIAGRSVSRSSRVTTIPSIP